MAGDCGFLLFCNESSDPLLMRVDLGAITRHREHSLEVGNAVPGPQVTGGLVLGAGHGHAGLRVQLTVALVTFPAPPPFVKLAACVVSPALFGFHGRFCGCFTPPGTSSEHAAPSNLN